VTIARSFQVYVGLVTLHPTRHAARCTEDSPMRMRGFGFLKNHAVARLPLDGTSLLL